MSNPWHFYIMALLYVFAGTMHFVRPKMYMRIMPKYLPAHKFLVISSGIIEIILGAALCYTPTKKLAIYGIVVMLGVFLTVHFYMLIEKNASMNLPKWLLLLRIPLQFVLMYWAFSYL